MTRRRGSLALLGAAVLCLVAAPAHGAGAAGPVTAGELAPGVVHEVWSVPGSSAQVHLARVEPSAGAQLRVVQASDRVAGQTETTSAMCARRPGCQVALNGDFLTPAGPVGGVIADGRLLRSPRPDHEQLSVDPLRATTVGLGEGGWAGVVQPADGGEALPVDGVNVALRPDSLVLYTSAYGSATPACVDCLEVRLAEGSEAIGVLGRPTAATVDATGSGATLLSDGVAVLAGHGTALDGLRSLAVAGRPLAITLSVAQPSAQNVGVHPVVLRDGQRVPLDPNDRMLFEHHPRTAVGWSTAGTLWLVAFDGRRPGGPGATADQVASFLLGLGATDAVMLDGGGSTTLATSERALNVPSDGRERPVSNALVVVTPEAAAPVPVPVPPPAPEPVVVVAAPPAVEPAAAPVVVERVARTLPLRRPAVDEPAPGAAAGRPVAAVRPEAVPEPLPTGAVLLAAALAVAAAGSWGAVARPRRLVPLAG